MSDLHLLWQLVSIYPGLVIDNSAAFSESCDCDILEGATEGGTLGECVVQLEAT